MQFRVLGSLEVVAAEGTIELPGAKERAVLAYLLAHLGRSVSTDEIVDAVWGERAPASATRSLHARVSRLRRLLEPGRAAASQSVIQRDGVGYRLAVSTDDVDAERFARLVMEARDLAPRESLAKAEEALELWRGEPYGPFQQLEFAQAENRRLMSSSSRRASCDTRRSSSSEGMTKRSPTWSCSSSNTRCASRSPGS